MRKLQVTFKIYFTILIANAATVLWGTVKEELSMQWSFPILPAIFIPPNDILIHTLNCCFTVYTRALWSNYAWKEWVQLALCFLYTARYKNWIFIITNSMYYMYWNTNSELMHSCKLVSLKILLFLKIFKIHVKLIISLSQFFTIRHHSFRSPSRHIFDMIHISLKLDTILYV